ncbi:hypothetical protein OHQ88_33510 (plasmid) [Micromonospora zamorensis]|uniref:hypothetical protein n=1 Tax=Micromonospora zamorensis TaxID=709883 RepID=UPI002E247107
MSTTFDSLIDSLPDQPEGRPPGPGRLVTWRPALLAAPPLVATLLGLAHPHHLHAATASRWLVLHIILLFVFPLIAVGLIAVVFHAAPCLPARHLIVGGTVVTAVLCAVCYSTLDVLAGIGAGVLVGQGLATGELDPQILALQRVAEPFGTAGGAALVCCAALAGYAVWTAVGRAALPGVLLTLVGAWGLVQNHVYWPLGTLTTLSLAAGVWVLARAVSGYPGRSGCDNPKS